MSEPKLVEVRPRGKRYTVSEGIRLTEERNRHREKSSIEPRTGFLNIDGAREELRRRIASLNRHSDPDRSFAAVVVDIKNFKYLNDKLGYLKGNIIINLITSLMRKLARGEDAFWRIGGDEFAWILEEQSLEKLNKMIFEGRQGNLQTGQLPGWLVQINRLIREGVLKELTGTDLDSADIKDAGDLRAGIVFFDKKWLRDVPAGRDIVGYAMGQIELESTAVKLRDKSDSTLKTITD